ncbi:hypothetical protein PPERSA_12191 [Pseudocohnilembus persalinus]|uniref:Uncharacterized protein n=1 Tax=Pseudocohnilembus persalinus TaxID=266149 RepID=A0A0V0R9F5_PSEPJ|nr:hypothetical protein PPERSA_12191 [Pseudocohnilembus persalinus]|eukprot:KRX10840.1 hypothetical protein PPERSA_12191 [Pseudocohnilembus persalinus]
MQKSHQKNQLQRMRQNLENGLDYYKMSFEELENIEVKEMPQVLVVNSKIVGTFLKIMAQIEVNKGIRDSQKGQVDQKKIKLNYVFKMLEAVMKNEKEVFKKLGQESSEIGVFLQRFLVDY